MQNVTLGERIQVLRKNMKMSQKEFAVFLEIPQPSLSAYENNRNSPTVEVLINIAMPHFLRLAMWHIYIPTSIIFIV